MVAVFYDKEGKKIKTTRFGADGYSDFTKNKDPETKKKDIFNDIVKKKGGVMTASTLSKKSIVE